jgi:hypothetical protein
LSDRRSWPLSSPSGGRAPSRPSPTRRPAREGRRGGPCPPFSEIQERCPTAASARRSDACVKHSPSGFARQGPYLFTPRPPVAPTPQSQAHRGPFAQDWNNDSKNQQSRPKHHALGCSGEIATRRILSTELAEQRRYWAALAPGVWPCCGAFFLLSWNKFNNPSVDHSRPRRCSSVRLHCHMPLGIARHIQRTAACGPMVAPMVAWPERRNPKAPLPHENAGASNLADSRPGESRWLDHPQRLASDWKNILSLPKRRSRFMSTARSANW